MTIVVSICDRTGNMVRPWIEAGYHALTFDLQDAPAEKGRTHFRLDVTAVGAVLAVIAAYRMSVAAAFAAPPCTHVAVSGARHFRTKGLDKLVEALVVINACRKILEALGCKWALENPVSVISSYWRQPDHTFHPCHYTGFEAADNYTKKTCLWTGGGFVMPEPFQISVEPPDDRIHKAPPSAGRADFRAAAPMGFSRAVFAANGAHQFAEAA